MDAFTGYRLVERVLAHGETKSSVLLWGGFQADLRLVPARERRRRAAVLHRLEGAQHRAARPRHPARLQAERVRPVSRRRRHARGRRDRGEHLRGAGPGVRSAGAAREPRRDRGRRSPARCPRLVTRAGPARRPAHAHDRHRRPRRRRDDGAGGARRRPRVHRHHRSQPGAGDGQRPRRARARSSTPRRSARSTAATLDGITRAGGHRVRHPRRTAGWTSPTTASPQLDIVIASVHSAFNQDEAQMTDRLLRAIECPWVDVLAHPTGRLILQARALPRQHGSRLRRGGGARRGARDQQPARSARSRRHARAAGARPRRQAVIDSDAHSPAALGNLRWGVAVARRAWLEPAGRPQHATDRATSARRCGATAADCGRDGATNHPERNARRASGRGDPRRDPRALLQGHGADHRAGLRSRHRSAEDRLPAEDRQRATVYMEGLAEMRKDWKSRKEAPYLQALDHELARRQPQRLRHVAVDGEHLDVALVEPLQQLHRDARAASWDS